MLIDLYLLGMVFSAIYLAFQMGSCWYGIGMPPWRDAVMDVGACLVLIVFWPLTALALIVSWVFDKRWPDGW